jgi:Leucine-rich repeat (LRR) protein
LFLRIIGEITVATIVYESEGKRETLELPENTREISLKRMDITSIDTESFTNFNSLTELELGFNKLGEFDLNGLRECKSLRYLSLQNNELSEIDLSELAKFD